MDQCHQKRSFAIGFKSRRSGRPFRAGWAARLRGHRVHFRVRPLRLIAGNLEQLNRQTRRRHRSCRHERRSAAIPACAVLMPSTPSPVGALRWVLTARPARPNCPNFYHPVTSTFPLIPRGQDRANAFAVDSPLIAIWGQEAMRHNQPELGALTTHCRSCSRVCVTVVAAEWAGTRWSADSTATRNHSSAAAVPREHGTHSQRGPTTSRCRNPPSSLPVSRRPRMPLALTPP